MSGLETHGPHTNAAPTHAALFLAFLKIGALGFGGVAAWSRHVLVVERRFMDAQDFARSFGLASTLPGANTVNMSVMLGDRYRGASGALAAVVGLMGAPLAILVVIAMLYARYGGLPDVRAALLGAAAAAAGVVIGTSLKILRDLDPDMLAILTAAAVCLAAAAKVPMLLILVVAIPLAIAGKLVGKRRA